MGSSAPGSITCPVCGKTSRHPQDVENGYCGNCHAFTGNAKLEAMLPPLPPKWSEHERTQNCPSCLLPVTMTPYDIGSGPEMSCSHCEWCWGADGQPLKPLPGAPTGPLGAS